MRTLTLLLLSLFLTSFDTSDAKEKSQEKGETVLICTGKYSKRYHKSVCKGLENCKGERQKIDLSKAEQMGLTKCRICYK